MAKEFSVDIRTFNKHLNELNINKNRVYSENDRIEKRKQLLTVLKSVLESKRYQIQIESKRVK